MPPKKTMLRLRLHPKLPHLHPSPKYDENEQKRREIARIRKEEVSSIQKVILEIKKKKMEDRDLEAVRALTGIVEKKLLKLL
jgi:hypothetical protein